MLRPSPYQDYLKIQTQLTITALLYAVRHGMASSYNRPGHCTDNAHMESFYHSLKAELIRGRRFESETELRHSLNSYINQFYNHKRLHSAPGYQPPAVYEKIAA